MQYEDMIVEVRDFVRAQTADNRRVGRFKVHVLQTPNGATTEGGTPVEYEVRALNLLLQKLEHGPTQRQDLLDVGRMLAQMLLPPSALGGPSDVHDLFRASLNDVGQDKGLRLRLRLPAELAFIPWEFVYLERAGGDGMDGFLALDPRVAIVRHEALAAPAAQPAASGTLKLVAAFASHFDLPPLDLAKERANLQEALAGQPGINPTYLDPVTRDALLAAMPDSRIFHFAGHGAFRTELSGLDDLAVSPGYLAFEDSFVDAGELGINLRGNGVRLVVLGGCETARRDSQGGSVWGGVVNALVKAEIPAIVGNQYRIQDKSAIAFSKHFYEAIAGGLPIEQAVTLGRVAIFNSDPQGRDWGVPALYLRARNGELFEGAPDAPARAQARASAEVNVNQRVKELAAGGYLGGAEVRQMLAGTLNVNMVIDGVVYGKVVGVVIDQLGGGEAHVDQDAGTVGQGGVMVGAQIGQLGGGGAIANPSTGATGQSSSQSDRGLASVQQNIGTVAGGGAVVGSVIGGQGPVFVGGQQHFGKEVQGNETTINTGGGAFVGGNVTTSGGTFTGRDSFVVGEGGTLVTTTGGAPAAAAADGPRIEEAIRLDVAAPATGLLDEPFDLAVSVRQIDAPLPAVEDLAQVRSEEGHILRAKEYEGVTYRVEVAGSGVAVTPPHYRLLLRPGENSRPYFFQVTPTRPGRRSLVVTAYQEDETVAAQTRVRIDVQVEVQP